MVYRRRAARPRYRARRRTFRAPMRRRRVRTSAVGHIAKAIRLQTARERRLALRASAMHLLPHLASVGVSAHTAPKEHHKAPLAHLKDVYKAGTA